VIAYDLQFVGPLRRNTIATPAREPTPTPLSDEEDEPIDRVRLYEEGWRYRYYQNKFSFHSENEEELKRFQKEVVRTYVIGLLWVAQYYYQGCPSWKWFYPFHYAPFASDFKDITSIDVRFEKGFPFRPLEQLMGVFPAASGKFLPATWRALMESTVISFELWIGVLYLPSNLCTIGFPNHGLLST
jgi:5'-3' exoribonuclease 2